MKRLFTILLLSYSYLSAQTVLTGRVLDEKSTPIAGVLIKVENASLGAKTDANGQYKIIFPGGGNYTIVLSYIGYEKETIQVVLSENQTLEKNLSLKSSNKKIKEVKIKGAKSKETEAATLQEQKNQITIKETMGAQEMSRKGASNAEAAVVKMAGVSKSEGSNQIYVRGLGDRYNSTTLNGMFLPSDNPEYKNISLEYFPSEVIQSIGVTKTFNNTLFGDFAGATIDIATKEFSGKPFLNVGYKVGVNSQAIGNRILGSGVSFLGGVSNTNLPETNLTKFFTPEWNGQERSQPHINNELSLSAGWSKNYSENRSLSIFGTTAMSNKFEYFEGMTKTVNAQNAPLDSSSKIGSSYLVNNNLMLNIHYKHNEKWKFKANYLFFRTVANQVNQYPGYDFNLPAIDYKQRILKDINTLHIAQFLIDYKHSPRLNFNLGIAYNFIESNQPNRITYHFVKPYDKYIFNTNSKGDQNVYYQNLSDKDISVNLNTQVKLGKSIDADKYSTTLYLGYTLRGKERNFDQYQYNFVPFNSNSLNITPETTQDFFTEQNFNSGNFNIQGEREAGRIIKPSVYSGTLYVNSPSIALEHNFSEKLNIIFGSRADLINQEVVWDVTSTSPAVGNIAFDHFKILPYLNGRYKLTENQNIKFAASKTYTLPQFKEMAPFLYIDINTFNSQGNPYLYPSDNYNLDLKWEMFPKKNELLSLAGFGKMLQNPINKVFIASSSSNTMSYLNTGNSAIVLGAELELKKYLFNHLNSDSARLKHAIQFGFNFSYLYSIQDLENGKAARETNNYLSTIYNNTSSKLQGASPIVTNVDISWTLKKGNYEPTFTLVANYFSDRLFVIGYQGVGDIYERGVVTLDFISKHNLSKRLSLSASIKNMLNPSIERYQEYKDQKIIVSTFKRGINASLGINYNF